MPLPIFSLPAHIRDLIVGKMDIADFVNFHKSSEKSFEAAKKVKTRFVVENRKEIHESSCLYLEHSNEGLEMHIRRPFRFFRKPCPTHIYNYPVRFENFVIYIKSVFTDEFCFALRTFLEQTNSSIKLISFEKFIPFEKLNCSPHVLNQLAETQKVGEFRFSKPISPHYMRNTAVKNISRFAFGFIGEAEIFALDALKYSINATNLSSMGVNRILKELISGKRRIHHCYVSTLCLQKNIVLEGIPILDSCIFNDTQIVHIGKETTYKIEISDIHVMISKESAPKRKCEKRKMLEELFAVDDKDSELASICQAVKNGKRGRY